MIQVFDFFSGCGGSSAGFKSAGLEIVLGVDIDLDSSKTFLRNFKGASFIREDIREIEAKRLAPWLEQRIAPVLFCGCAPCQPFSRQNRTQSLIDPRRDLLGEFGRFVKYWLPDYVFIENVPGIQKVNIREGPLAKFTRLLKKLGYFFDVKVVPALWYGVPQTRERLVLVACLNSEIEIPQASHGSKKKPFSTVRDWIYDLPILGAGSVDPFDPDHQAAALSHLNMQRIQATPEGGGRESWPSELCLECHKEHKGHTDVYGRLSWDKPASGLTTRCISYSNGRFGHPEQDRAITVREAARLQTFPKKYKFYGSLASRAKQIGNAVPPKMAFCVGRALMDHHKSSGVK